MKCLPVVMRVVSSVILFLAFSEVVAAKSFDLQINVYEDQLGSSVSNAEVFVDEVSAGKTDDNGSIILTINSDSDTSVRIMTEDRLSGAFFLTNELEEGQDKVIVKTMPEGLQVPGILHLQTEKDGILPANPSEIRFSIQNPYSDNATKFKITRFEYIRLQKEGDYTAIRDVTELFELNDNNELVCKNADKFMSQMPDKNGPIEFSADIETDTGNYVNARKTLWVGVHDLKISLSAPKSDSSLSVSSRSVMLRYMDNKRPQLSLVSNQKGEIQLAGMPPGLVEVKSKLGTSENHDHYSITAYFNILKDTDIALRYLSQKEIDNGVLGYDIPKFDPVLSPR